jgi:hypothetical protein
MYTSKYPIKMYLMLSSLILVMIELTGCGGIEVGVEDISSTETETREGKGIEFGIEPTPMPAQISYTNDFYGFQFDYPETWRLTEGDQSIILKKGINRLGINFRRVDEDIHPDFSRTGVGTGDIIYRGKINFMGKVIPVKVLLSELKSKAVFYGENSFIEVEELVFAIALEDLDTDFIEVDLTEEILLEANLILESFARTAAVIEADPPSGPTGLKAHLNIKDSFQLGGWEKVRLHFLLKNHSETPVYLLKWFTPLEGVAGDIFEVKRDGQILPYLGILASRTDPTPESYVLLEPGESVYSEIDIGTSYDFSHPGTYKIKFHSPRSSHFAYSEGELATTLDELGPVYIPSDEVSVELIGSPPGIGLTLRRTPDEAKELILAYLRDQKPDLVQDLNLPIEEIPIEGPWEALQAQIFRVKEGIFRNESFLIRGVDVIQLGSTMGGQGITSLVLTDLDQDGQTELLFVYSSGSGIHQSRIGMYAPAYDEYRIFEADISYLGNLRLYSENPPDVRVQVVEADRENLILRYLDMIGNLSIEGHEGQVRLVMHVFPGLPAEIQQKISSD